MGRGDLQIVPTMAGVVFVGIGLLTCPLCADCIVVLDGGVELGAVVRTGWKPVPTGE
jgi:hypothetical protein